MQKLDKNRRLLLCIMNLYILLQATSPVASLFVALQHNVSSTVNGECKTTLHVNINIV